MSSLAHRACWPALALFLTWAACGSGAEIEAVGLPAAGSGVAGAPAVSVPVVGAGAPAVGAPAAGSVAAPGGGRAGAAGLAAPAGAGAAGAAGPAVAADPNRDPEVPCAVFKALANACHRCHGAVPTGGAPMALVHLADFQVLSVTTPKIPKYELARMRMDGSRRPLMPPVTSPPITEADKKTLIDWLSSGAPAATGEAVSCN